ncbi:hypothetical protein Ate02nite_84590 [Paractinoplanes tereljensis]|uniref:Uncharacterized protein n=1 Tax=Paractinoplanes tereljensis TaxID=571912 RepID=A0A919TY12_9ACTN|nr:hypothetical protein Ate02nite_84590 [Actinoplanes tereljensis]
MNGTTLTVEIDDATAEIGDRDRPIGFTARPDKRDTKTAVASAHRAQPCGVSTTRGCRTIKTAT